MTDSSIYIRLVFTSPSVFEDPNNAAFLERFLANFRLRGDEEYLSLWEPNPRNCSNLPVAWAVFARDRSDNINFLEIPAGLFEQAGIEVFPIPDHCAFRCIEDAHFGFRPQEDALRTLAEAVQAMLIADPDRYRRIRRQKLPALVQELDGLCRDTDSNPLYDGAKVRPWAQKILAA